MNWTLIAGLALLFLCAAHLAHCEDDPYLWLEDVTGKKALDYVEAQNAITVKELEARPEYAGIKAQVLAILNAKEKIPYATKQGAWLYNFWQDEKHVRGLWRRTTLEEYRKTVPAWETVLDIDALAAEEKENWVWAGAESLPPKHERFLLSFSRGGGDAKVVREFDAIKKEFVKNGFNLPEAKSAATWRNLDELYVGTNFGEGSLTDSGYPRIIKLWKRGTPLSAAEMVFEGQKTDVEVGAWVDHTPGFFREGFQRNMTFYTSEKWLVVDGKKVKLDVPEDANMGTFRQFLTLTLRSDWNVGTKTFKSGSLLISLDKSLSGERSFDTLFEPSPRVSLQGMTTTKNYIAVEVSDNVHTRLYGFERVKAVWNRFEIKIPGQGTANVRPFDADESNDVWIDYNDFLTPDSLYLMKLGANLGQPIKSRPKYFDTTGMEVQQFEATSKDGTKVPYFVVGKTDAIKSGTAPTILYGYGGFEIPMLPMYSAGIGTSWLAKGGVYVLANIRGGGEFGPAWHQAAQKSKRQNAFDDFEAVAEDLAKRGIAQARHLGIMGGSNGGLLVSTVAIQRPELFHAVVCQVPLTDMRRYHKLLAGASWMAEYGDPDKPEEWEYLSKFSPYQNVKKEAKYPRILFTTSTRDDRVHPGHARKLYAKMKDMGHDVLYYENTEGGHGGAANNEQRARMHALEFTFLLNELR
ncbi:MAG TPA: prolyl oligopeptidase family serine peptidase [Planctomycetota bacterium]|nr:prolyl oligopeptidase family serine peptidase [Planctomycetota bacterium]